MDIGKDLAATSLRVNEAVTLAVVLAAGTLESSNQGSRKLPWPQRSSSCCAGQQVVLAMSRRSPDAIRTAVLRPGLAGCSVFGIVYPAMGFSSSPEAGPKSR
jgi:hypothetical protein